MMAGADVHFIVYSVQPNVTHSLGITLLDPFGMMSVLLGIEREYC